MRARRPRPVCRPRAVTLSVLALVAFALALQLDAMRPLHTHHDGTAGFYNEEHVLAALGALSRIVSLPADAPTMFVPAAGTACVVGGGAHLGSGFAGFTDSRAPPLA